MRNCRFFNQNALALDYREIMQIRKGRVRRLSSEYRTTGQQCASAQVGIMQQICVQCNRYKVKGGTQEQHPGPGPRLMPYGLVQIVVAKTLKEFYEFKTVLDFRAYRLAALQKSLHRQTVRKSLYSTYAVARLLACKLICIPNGQLQSTQAVCTS